VGFIVGVLHYDIFFWEFQEELTTSSLTPTPPWLHHCLRGYYESTFLAVLLYWIRGENAVAFKCIANANA
jgi:hypothetical protein